MIINNNNNDNYDIDNDDNDSILLTNMINHSTAEYDVEWWVLISWDQRHTLQNPNNDEITNNMHACHISIKPSLRVYQGFSSKTFQRRNVKQLFKIITWCCLPRENYINLNYWMS